MFRALKRMGSNALRSRGFTVTRIRERNLYPSDQRHGFFHLLNRLAFSPTYIVDIGANRGNWSRDAIKFFPKCSFTLIEPNQQLKPYFDDLLALNQVEWMHAGAGKSKSELRFTIAERDDSSSFTISDEEAARRGLQQVVVPVVCLNDLVGEMGRPIPDLVKIDAEGLDVEVLEGATNLFGQTEIFCVEVGFAPAREATSLRRVVNMMHEFGYLPYDVTEFNRSVKTRVLWLCEFCFVRKDSKLLQDLSYEG